MKQWMLGMMMVCLLGWAGCVPPMQKAGSLPLGALIPEGHRILRVHPKPRSPFVTVEKNGVEYRQARGPLGRPGGTFYGATTGDGPKTFNPWASYDSTSSRLGGMLVSGLVETDAYTGEVNPYLAKDIQVSPDKCTYRVTLRKGLQWSDGKPLTAKDVVFTWNEIIKPGLGNPSVRDILLVDGKFPVVRAVDPLTIEFKTANPFAPFLRQLGMAIAPEHIFGPIVRQGGDKAFSAAWGTRQATEHPEQFVSSGMWILTQYEAGERVVYERNPHFFMIDKAGKRLPYLKRYVMSFVKDTNNLQLQFEQGRLDSYGVPGQFVAHTRRLPQPSFNLYNLGPTTGTTFLAFNLSTRNNPETKKPQVDPIKARWFHSQSFRQAVDWAIHRDDMVKNILRGVGAPLFTAESLSSIYLNQQLASGHPANLQQAKALLKQGGFSWNGKGQLLDAHGHPVEFTLYTNTGNDQREATGVSIKQDLAALGMQVNFKPMDFNVLVNKLQTGEWETVIMGLSGSPLEPHDGANVWKSDGGLHLFNQRDVKTGKKVDLSDRLPWEAELDRLFEQGAQTLEKAQRQKIYDRYQQILYEQVPMIYLYSPLDMVAIKTRVQNVDPTPLETFHNMEEVWVKE